MGEHSTQVYKPCELTNLKKKGLLLLSWKHLLILRMIFTPTAHSEDHACFVFVFVYSLKCKAHHPPPISGINMEVTDSQWVCHLVYSLITQSWSKQFIHEFKYIISNLHNLCLSSVLGTRQPIRNPLYPSRSCLETKGGAGSHSTHYVNCELHKLKRKQLRVENKDVAYMLIILGSVYTVEAPYCGHPWGSPKCPD